MFKLYLYGIEINIILFRLALPSVVQIVPLWNLKVQFEPDGAADTALKRLFLELKWQERKLRFRVLRVQIVPLWNWNSRFKAFTACGFAFKLYLYGIEMETAETLIESLQSSNCTFMELKCLNCMIRNSSDKRFKLYLYGIEIDKLCTVPPPHSSFKLYLYGIEITKV